MDQWFLILQTRRATFLKILAWGPNTYFMVTGRFPGSPRFFTGNLEPLVQTNWRGAAGTCYILGRGPDHIVGALAAFQPRCLYPKIFVSKSLK